MKMHNIRSNALEPADAKPIMFPCLHNIKTA